MIEVEVMKKRAKANQDLNLWLHYLAICAALALGTFFTTGCELTEEQDQALQDVLSPPENGPGDIPPPIPDEENCHSVRYEQPPEVVTNKLVLLFAVDTSGSMNQEKAEIVEGIHGGLLVGSTIALAVGAVEIWAFPVAGGVRG